MVRFDVYRNESTASAKRFPCLLVVQSDFLENLSTMVVVPLGKPAVVDGCVAQTLTPVLDVNGEALVMYTPQLAAVHAAVLKKHLGNLENQRDAIVRALDFLFSGI